MKKISKLLHKISFIVIIIFSVNAESSVLSIGEKNSKVVVKVFSSLTCPHCAEFHKNIYYNLKKDYIDKGLVRFEHNSFPLDLAALNAEIIVRCHESNQKKFQLLGEIYKKQNKWAVGSDINVINKSIKKIGLDSGLKNDKMDMCLTDDALQEQILKERIDSQKKYKISATPTIIINEKKYEGSHVYKSFKKIIDKNL